MSVPNDLLVKALFGNVSYSIMMLCRTTKSVFLISIWQEVYLPAIMRKKFIFIKANGAFGMAMRCGMVLRRLGTSENFVFLKIW